MHYLPWTQPDLFEASKNTLKIPKSPLLVKGFLVEMLLPRTGCHLQTVHSHTPSRTRFRFTCGHTVEVGWSHRKLSWFFSEFRQIIVLGSLFCICCGLSYKQMARRQTVACSTMMNALTHKLECCHGDNGPDWLSVAHFKMHMKML